MRFSHLVSVATDTTEHVTHFPPASGVFTNFEVFVVGSAQDQVQVVFGKQSSTNVSAYWLDDPGDSQIIGSSQNVVMNLPLPAPNTDSVSIVRVYSPKKLKVLRDDITVLSINTTGSATVQVLVNFDFFPFPNAKTRFQVLFTEAMDISVSATRDFYMIPHSMYLEGLELSTQISEGTNSGSGELVVEIWENYEESYPMDTASSAGWAPYSGSTSPGFLSTEIGRITWKHSAQEADATATGMSANKVMIPVGRKIKKGSMVMVREVNPVGTSWTSMTSADLTITFLGKFTKDSFNSGSFIENDNIMTLEEF